MHPCRAKALSVKLLTVIACPASVVVAAAVWLAGGHLELMCIDKGRQQKADSHRADSQHTLSAFLPSVRNQCQLLNWLNDYFLSLRWKKHKGSWVFSAYIHYIWSDWALRHAIKNNLYNYFSLAECLWDQRQWNTMHLMYFAMNK